MEGESVQCPDCDDGVLVGMFPKYTEGWSGPSYVLVDCGRCVGTGKVSAEMTQWIEVGHKCRRLRESRYLGLRDGAAEYGMKPSELSRIESGKVDPTQHAICLGVLDKEPGSVVDH